MTARGIVRPAELVVVTKEAHEAVADYLMGEIEEYLEAVEFFRAEGCDIIPQIAPAPALPQRPRWGVWRWSVGG